MRARNTTREPKRATGVRIEESQVEAVKKLATKENRTFSNMVSTLISEALAVRLVRTKASA